MKESQKKNGQRWLSLCFSMCFLLLGFQFSCGTSVVQEPAAEGKSDGSVSTDASGSSEQDSKEAPKEGSSSVPLDLSERLPKGTARAGVIRSDSEFIGGPNAKEKVGDIKLYNSKVAFTVAGKRVVNGYLSRAGKLVAADIVRPQGQPGQSLFQEFTLAFQHRMMAPETVEIVNNGADGKAAVVRLTGKDSGLDLLLSYIKALAPSLAEEAGDLDFQITTEYRLEPDSDTLSLKVTLKNVGSRYKDISFSEIGMFMGDGLTNYFPNKGDVNGTGALGYWPYHGLASPKVGYTVFPAKGEQFQSLVKYKTVLIGLQDSFTLEAGASKTLLWHIAVGRDLAAAQAAYRRIQPKYQAGTVKGRILDPDTQKPLAGQPIYIEQAQSDGSSAYIGQAISQSDGTYTAELPPGDYTLRTARHQELSKSVSLSLKANDNKTLDLSSRSSGTLQVTITEQDGTTPLPAKVSVAPLDSRDTKIPSRYGRRSYAGGAVMLAYPHNGKANLSLGSGRYRVTITRGFFYSQHQQEVTLESGKTSSIEVSLQQQIATAGYLSGDFHVHAHGSPDSQDSNRAKVSAMAAEGLELAVSTDHEFVTDYQPTIKAMGLEKRLRAVIGEEVTTYFGHFNPYPILFRPKLTNNGAFQWYKLKAPAMFDLIQKEAPNSLIQINHPRGAAAGSYFSYVGYNPETGKAEAKPDEWSWNFHTIEVINGNGFNAALNSTLPDWYSMLNRGYRITAMGNSDSHSMYTSEVGYPRNLVQLGSNDPTQLTPTILSQALKRQKVVVSGGAMIRFQASADNNLASAVPLGEILTLSDTGKAHLHIKVEAHPSVHLNKLEIIENGKVIDTRTLNSKDLLRFDETIEVTPAKDSWYIVMVTGTKSHGPLAPGSRPFAFTNPIFVDANKNKKFDPPIAP